MTHRRYRGVDTEEGWIRRALKDLQDQINRLGPAKTLESSSVDGGVVTVVEILKDPTKPTGYEDSDAGTALVDDDTVTLTLTRTPLTKSLKVFHNGVRLEATEFTRVDRTVTIEPSDDVVILAGDRFTTWYAYDATAPAPTPTPVGSEYADQVIADGATAYWRRGEPSGTVMVDVVGGHDGSYLEAVNPPFWSSPTLGIPGLLLPGDTDTATMSDGTNDCSVVPDGAWMDVSGSLSLECLIEASDFASAPFGVRGLLCRDENSVTAQRVFAWSINSAGKLVFIKNPGGDGGLGTATSTSATTLATGTRYHLLVVIDGTDIRQYINGVLDVTTPAAFAFNNPPSNSRLAVGGGFAGGNSPLVAPFAGVLDECAMYVGTALTAAQALDHAEKAGF